MASMSSALGMNLMPTAAASFHTTNNLAADTNGNLDSNTASAASEANSEPDLSSATASAVKQNDSSADLSALEAKMNSNTEEDEDSDNKEVRSENGDAEADLEEEEEEEEAVVVNHNDNAEEDSSLMEDGDGTYGSPGLRRAFSGQDDLDDLDDEDTKGGEESPAPSSNSRKNKRKNFKPRNINYMEETSATSPNQALNLSSNDPRKMSLMPRKLEKDSPMDLSVQGSNEDDEEMESDNDNNDEGSNKPSTPTSAAAHGLSLVRPEILFGGGGSGNPKDLAGGGALPPGIPPLLAPFLAKPPPGLGMPTNAMKDAFQEVLKLFGFTPELAEAFAKNAQALQQQQEQAQQQSNNDTGDSKVQPKATLDSEKDANDRRTPSTPPPAGGMPPGMLSAALMGTPPSGTPPGSTHPPTPPRTPKGLAAAMAAASGIDSKDLKPPMAHQQPGQPSSSSTPGGGSSAPPMPPLLSLAAIQDQVKGPNILAAQLSKPMMLPGMPTPPAGPMGLPSGPPGMAAAMAAAAGMPPQIPPHILAAQRAGVLPGSPKVSTDYTRYFKRFGSSLECGAYYCKDMNYREHFHCTVPMCRSKMEDGGYHMQKLFGFALRIPLQKNPTVFAKKEEMIRHSKWHQKMDEAFKYGFRRVTPTDDCGDQFPGCQHNKKQTHYHCIVNTQCDKVYISTSDVQMHFNYHRKDNAIQREGFLRFRGCDDCATHYCPFRDQKTTHFHCNRTGCEFTFKNKADMEKHKNFHMKDEQLNNDGFKKFMKADPCGYETCRFSKTVNHIHCIRDNCDYVLHSSGQLFAHKRRHERKDNELAYRKYKLTQSMLANLGGNPTEEQKEQIANLAAAAAASLNGSDLDRPDSNGSMESDDGSANGPLMKLPPSMQPQPNFHPPPPPPPAGFNQPLPPSSLLGLPPVPPQGPQLLSEIVRERVPDDAWHAYILHFDAGEGCGFQSCDIEDLGHYHCKDDGCEMVFRHEDGVREHGRNHFIQDQLTDLFFIRGDPEDEPEMNECPEGCPHKKSSLHYHCKWENCNEVIFQTDPPFKRLDHYKLHEYTKKWNFSTANKEPVSMTLTTSIDAMFKRKRGRPPKNRVIEVWNDNFPGGPLGGPGAAEMHGSPQAVFTSFKLPKPGQPGGGSGGPATTPSPAEFPSLPLSPVTSMPSGLGSRLFPMGMAPVPQSGLPKIQAPLGGLPALADQLSQQAKKESPVKASQDDEGKDEEEKEPAERSPPSTPPPAKRRNEGTESGSNSDDSPPKNQGMIKAKGTYYPLSAFPTNMPQGPVMRRDESPPRPEQQNSGDETSPTISLKSKLGVNFMVSFTRSGETENPLAKLLQASADMVGGSSPSPSSSAAGPVSSISEAALASASEAVLSIAAHPQFGPEPEEKSCGRPFCKLKRRAHFHCNLCNQGFTERDKLDSHLKRHLSPENATAPSPLPQQPNLAALLKEPLPPEEAARISPLSLVVASSASNKPPASPPPPITSTASASLGVTSTGSTASSSPKSSPPPIACIPTSNPLSPSASSPLSSLTSSSPNTSIPGLPPGFPASLSSLMRHPLTGLPGPPGAPGGSPLLPANPFLPPGLSLPGLPPGFPRFPGLGIPPSEPPRLPTLPTSPVTAAALQSLSRLPDPSSLKRSSPMSAIMEDDSLTMEQKKIRLQTSMRMLSKDEPVPEGYMRFRFNEDCGFPCCNYREHQTHFHCMRKDCNYRFCDKTRFVQHTARHERLDTLCGEEFEGFRGVPCGREGCELNTLHLRMPITGDAQKSSSHFHCRKCDYYCTDTNKVVAHRRQHQKLDSIMAAGFEKYTPTQFCPVAGCAHNGKQTHYHCSKCQYAVLGLSQMEGHKYRHANE